MRRKKIQMLKSVVLPDYCCDCRMVKDLRVFQRQGYGEKYSV